MIQLLLFNLLLIILIVLILAITKKTIKTEKGKNILLLVVALSTILSVITMPIVSLITGI